ncbi:MAG: bifunctional homocysteine S-methyltransferase/methylenetetrahydrofolate reductase [Chloroflexi bacterium]|nr:bifunctional homocysteine S-methyltransferase/methylenetetrahydrofolate reductase [Chloroflexota bacterium]
MTVDFFQLLNENTLVADGAMGTMLNARGVSFEKCFDELNLTNPAVVAEVHREYIEAGAQIILTNTFSANRSKLEKHGLQDKLAAINTAGVELAKRVAAASFKDVLIAGDLGPLGVRLAPFGRVQLEDARAAFAEQVDALCAAGVDLLVIETIADLYEAREAVQAAKEHCSKPVIVSVTFTRDGRTILGDTPEKAARVLAESGADVIGVNCSGGPAQLLRILRQMKLAVGANSRPYFWVKPNAGWPEQVGGRIMYPADPEYFGDYALSFRAAGANIVGGCCGTTPRHIAAMRKALDSAPAQSIIFSQPSEIPEISDDSEVEPPTRLAQKLADGKFAIAVEMDPPRGLSTHKLMAGASLLAEAGADVIDVADSPMARMRMSAWAVCDIVQRKVDVETTLHFPTRGRNLLRVQGDLLAAHALGIRNVFVVMGDPTSIGDYPEAADNYDIVPSGLIKLIKQGFNTGLDHSGASIGQPTNFFVGSALNLCPQDFAAEIKNLRRKLNSGADFFLTQPIFDPQLAEAFLKRYSSEFGALEKPVLVGILPLFSTRHVNFLHHEVPGISIPEPIRARMEKAGADGVKEGIRINIELVEQIKLWAQGIYVMPQFNRYDVVAEMIEAVI